MLNYSEVCPRQGAQSLFVRSWDKQVFSANLSHRASDTKIEVVLADGKEDLLACKHPLRTGSQRKSVGTSRKGAGPLTFRSTRAGPGTGFCSDHHFALSKRCRHPAGRKHLHFICKRLRRTVHCSGRVLRRKRSGKASIYNARFIAMHVFEHGRLMTLLKSANN